MNTQKTKGNKPTHYVRSLVGHGEDARFETIGAAWVAEGKETYVKLHGTQIVDGGFYILANGAKANQESGQ